MVAHQQRDMTHMLDRDGTLRPIEVQLGWQYQWQRDSRRFLAVEFPHACVTGYDAAAHRRMGRLVPWIADQHWVCIGPTGHYCGSEGIEAHLRYIAQLDDGSIRTYTHAEFTKEFGWKNDPERATLTQFDGEE